MPALTVVAVLIISLAVPASAVELIDYNDYVTNVGVDGDNDVVVVQFPSEWAYWGVWIPYPTSTWQVRGYGSSITWTASNARDLVLYPVGDAGSRLLDLSTIPNGSIFSFGIQIASDYAHESGNWELQVYYLDADGNTLTSDVVSMGSFTGYYEECSFTVAKPNGAKSMYFRFYVHSIEPLEEQYTLTMSIHDFQLQMSISALYRQQLLTGKTNELLEQVSDQLEEQGKTLDEILSGSQEDQDAANDFKDQITDQEEAIKDAEGVIDSAVNVDTTEVNNFFINLMLQLDIPYANTLALFWESTLLHNLLLMAAIFALLSFILFGKKG